MMWSPSAVVTAAISSPGRLAVRSGRPSWSPPIDFTFRNAQNPATDLDTASAVLAAAREETQVAEMAEARRFQRAVDWAAMHSVDSIGPAAVWEGELPIAGDGAPLVAEFCVAEFALAIGNSTDAGRAYLGEAVEVRYRLPRLWSLVVSGKLPVWKARQIAKATMSLPFEGAGFVDTHVAPTAARLSFAQLERVVEEARVRFDPVEAEARDSPPPMVGAST
jgi:hypothetical protein